MIWIRTDANREIGSGHVMRCLAIASALKRAGEQVCFLVSDEEALPLLQVRGQNFRVLHSEYTRLEEEWPVLESLLKEECPRVFLADSYFVTPDYLRRVGKWTAVGYLDDNCISDLPVDILINYNIFAKSALYGNLHKGRLLLGTAYAPLREEFTRVEYRVREKATQVLVTTGGSDKYDLAGKFLEKALAEPGTAGLRYNVVSGAFNVHLERLRTLEKKHENVKIYSNVSNMWELMQENDIAISAGGSTLYELSAVGVPMICFSFVDNQERIVEGFFKNGLTCFGGNYLTQGEKMLDEAVNQLDRLGRDAALRREYSKRQRQTVDGLGAARIAEALLEL